MMTKPGAKPQPNAGASGGGTGRERLADQVSCLFGTCHAKPLVWRLGLSAAIVLAALAIRVVMLGVLEQHLAYVTFFPAVAVAAIIAGVEGGTVALVLSAVLAHLFVPAEALVEWAGLTAFLASGAVIIGAVQALHLAQRKLATAEKAKQADQDLEQLSDANLRLNAIVSTAVDAIVVINEDGNMQSVNPATGRIFGYAEDELIGKNVKMLMPEDLARSHDSYLESYRTTGKRRVIGIGREMEGRRKDGTIFPIDLAIGEWTGARGQRYFTGIIRDITKRKQTERQLAQAQTMEAVGQLAGGLAHDINNILAIISGNLELTENSIKDAAPREAIQRAQDAVELGASLNRRLLTFARQRKTQPVKFDVNAHVRQVTNMLNKTLSERVQVATELAPDLWPTLADPHEVENALVNLAVNARDAMPQGGRLLIGTRNVTLDAAAVGQMEARGGDFVCLSVTDTGTGMTPDVRDRAIEPFFTTKEPGKGTGLGLSSVYGFIKQAGGHLSLESTVGQGTTVHLYLPRAPNRASTGADMTSSVRDDTVRHTV